MAIKTSALKRVFRYNAVDLPDPNPGLPVKKVVEALSAAYPEFTTAKVEPPVIEGDNQVFTIRIVAEEKG